VFATSVFFAGAFAWPLRVVQSLHLMRRRRPCSLGITERSNAGRSASKSTHQNPCASLSAVKRTVLLVVFVGATLSGLNPQLLLAVAPMKYNRCLSRNGGSRRCCRIANARLPPPPLKFRACFHEYDCPVSLSWDAFY